MGANPRNLSVLDTYTYNLIVIAEKLVAKSLRLPSYRNFST
jgi:hypothetical protein